ncbi:MAG: hypothetical protein LLG40_03240 [Deltaproteobacteria bacterium]|nr:hypothetical protein [Deltaproteobacteria bacterium]
MRKHSKTIFLLLVFSLLLCNSPIVLSATYYIDYVDGKDSNKGTSKSIPWKHCPGMQGFTGHYSHVAGDKFVFKGGVVWPSTVMPLILANSGSSDSCDLTNNIATCDQYTVDSTWYSGSSWSQPTFDGSGIKAGIYGKAGKSEYLIINNLKLINFGSYAGKDSVAAITLIKPNHTEIKNNYIESRCKICIQLADSSFENTSNILVHDNIIKNCFKQLTFDGGGKTIYKINSFKIYNNLFQGNTFYLGGQAHSNIIHIYSDSTSEPFTFTNLKIYNNVISGHYPYGFTAQIYLERAAQSAYIYNNVLAFDNSVGSGCSGKNYCNGIEFRYGGRVYIYNNTIASYGTNISNNLAQGTAIVASPIYCEYKGNIIYGTKSIGQHCECRKCVSDYNLIYPSSGKIGTTSKGIQKTTWTDWQASGYDTHGINADPSFNSFSDFQLQANSPARNAFPIEQTPRDIFTTDLSGITRPDSSAWDIGALQR